MTGLIAQACADAVSVRMVRIITGVLPAPRRVTLTPAGHALREGL